MAVEASDLSRLLDAHVRNWRTSAEAARQLLEPQPDSANNLGWGLLDFMPSRTHRTI